jgi:hypothetical protein
MYDCSREVEDLSVGEILDLFNHHENEVKLERMERKFFNRIWENDHDKICMSDLNGRNNPRTKSYQCMNCRILHRLIDLQEYTINEIITIEGTRIKVRITRIEKVFPRIETVKSGLILLDPFTLNVMNTHIIQNSLSGDVPSICQTILKSFVCGENGYLLTTFPNSLIISNPSNFIDDIIHFILILCIELNQHKFMMCDYSKSLIFYEVNSKFNDKYCRIIGKLNNLNNASVQLANSNRISGFHFNASKNNQIEINVDEFHFRVIDGNPIVLTHQKEYNFYNFILSLCEDRSFFLKLKENKLWRLMFVENEVIKLENELLNEKNEFNSRRLLSNVTLRKELFELLN